MAFHDFEACTDLQELRCWDKVVPGDLVHCPNTLAYRFCDFDRRDDAKLMQLAHRALLVVSRHDVPCSHDGHGDVERHFVALSRHGMIVIVRWGMGLVGDD